MLEQIEEKASDHQLTSKELRTQATLQDKLDKLQHKHNIIFLANELQRYLKARFLKPQRVMNLSLAEEKARAEATWQDFDYKIGLAAFGTAEQLRPYVVDPEASIEPRRQ